jgi:hypothetical protein
LAFTILLVQTSTITTASGQNTVTSIKSSFIVERPQIDGSWSSADEWKTAEAVTATSGYGDVVVRSSHDSTNLYFMVEFTKLKSTGQMFSSRICLDTLNDGGANPSDDDFCVLVSSDGGLSMEQGNARHYSYIPAVDGVNAAKGFTAEYSPAFDLSAHRTAEFQFPFTLIGNEDIQGIFIQGTIYGVGNSWGPSIPSINMESVNNYAKLYLVATASIESVGISRVASTDVNGGHLSKISPGQMVLFQVELSNESNEPTPATFILEVRDESGITEHLQLQTMTLLAESSITSGMSWIPNERGTFLVRCYALTELSSPKLLSAVSESNVIVS